MTDLNTPEYWNKVWSKHYKDDNKNIIMEYGKDCNNKEYWDKIWKNPRRKVEKYSMQRAWWKIQEVGAKSVLDAACGNGRLLYGIKQLVPEIKVFGVDISSVAIDRMKKEYNIDGVVMNVYDLDKLDKSFDFIVANHLLEHLWRDEEFVIKCKDKLNDGGYFYAAVPNNMSSPEETEEHVRMYNREMLESLIIKIFGNCKIEIIGNHLIGIAQKI